MSLKGMQAMSRSFQHETETPHGFAQRHQITAPLKSTYDSYSISSGVAAQCDTVWQRYIFSVTAAVLSSSPLCTARWSGLVQFVSPNRKRQNNRPCQFLSLGHLNGLHFCHWYLENLKFQNILFQCILNIIERHYAGQFQTYAKIYIVNI